MKYIDISMYQNKVDYATASEGLTGVMIRAGYGKGNEDEMFKKHVEGFSKYGVPIGVYWFSYACNASDAIIEAQYCISTIRKYKIELPVCFDFEDDSIKHAKSKGIKVTKALATEIAKAFLNEIEKNGYYAMLYTNPAYLRNYYGDMSKYDLWLASWLKTPNFEKPPQACGIWQYSNKGLWSGVSGTVDLDWSYKDYPKIIRQKGLNHLPTDKKLNWAKEVNLLVDGEEDSIATKGDLAKMLYDYHFVFGVPDDDKPSGLLS